MCVYMVYVCMCECGVACLASLPGVPSSGRDAYKQHEQQVIDVKAIVQLVQAHVPVCGCWKCRALTDNKDHENGKICETDETSAIVPYVEKDPALNKPGNFWEDEMKDLKAICDLSTLEAYIMNILPA